MGIYPWGILSSGDSVTRPVNGCVPFRFLNSVLFYSDHMRIDACTVLRSISGKRTLLCWLRVLIQGFIQEIVKMNTRAVQFFCWCVILTALFESSFGLEKPEEISQGKLENGFLERSSVVFSIKK